MSLIADDMAFLNERGFDYAVQIEAGMVCVLLKGFALPQGYNRAQADLLLRLQPTFPDTAPDMWWFDPPVVLANGQMPPQADLQESYLGRTWQRWSRHLVAGQWRSGVDSLETFIAIIRSDLLRWIPQQAIA